MTVGNAIEVEVLTKRFGNFTAVDHIDFKVEAGELFGFLGPNGTGKTNVVEQRKTPKQLARQEYLQVRGWERLRTTSRARRPTPTELALATGRYPEQMPLES